MAVYRISPMLWTDATGGTSMTVYYIDRSAPGLPTACTRRPKEDPASVWDGTTSQRLLPPPGSFTTERAVTWSTLPQWLSYAQTQGYTLGATFATQKLTPYTDIYITGPSSS